MRIGKWVPIYKRLLPIPRRLSMAFGLFEGSQLYLSRISDEDSPRKYGCEIIVSPVPFDAWRSSCRLSVRLNDRPGALARATSFIRSKKINVMLSECCSSYQHRAHWDAICDVTITDGFSRLKTTSRPYYDEEMQAYLKVIENEFKNFARDPENADAFTQGLEFLIELRPLTGLNDVSFACDIAMPVEHRGGAVEIEDRLAKEISAQCFTHGLPQHALITGNTEQRYMRVLFLRDFAQMFQLTVQDTLEGFPGGGVGVLNQLLAALPEPINLMRASTYIVSKTASVERGRIEILGHWDLPSVADPNAKRSHMKAELERIVNNLPIADSENTIHEGALHVAEFVTPHGHDPRVFISYSTSWELKKVQFIERALLAADFQPVLGTDMAQPSAETFIGDRQVSPDVAHVAFQAIHGCVAFVSLLVPRSDYCVTASKADRYVLPPWAVAEEVYAWAENIRRIIRIKHRAVELPPYNRHAETIDFESDDEFAGAVTAVVEALTLFRASPDFPRIAEVARQALFKARPVPSV